jgi:hypothetical protein
MTFRTGASRGIVVAALSVLVVLGLQTVSTASPHNPTLAGGHHSLNRLGPASPRVHAHAVASSQSPFTVTKSPTVQLTPRSSSAGVKATTADGFRFRVQADGVSLSVSEGHKMDQGSSPAVAPPGKDYIQIPLTITNLQNDRPLSLMDALAGPVQDGDYGGNAAYNGNGAGDFAIGLPPKDEGGGCPSNYLTPVNGVCRNPAYIVLSNGTDLLTAEDFQDSPNVRPGKSAKVTLYFGPVPAHTPLSAVTAFVSDGYNSGPWKTESIPLGK